MVRWKIETKASPLVAFSRGGAKSQGRDEASVKVLITLRRDVQHKHSTAIVKPIPAESSDATLKVKD